MTLLLASIVFLLPRGSEAFSANDCDQEKVQEVAPQLELPLCNLAERPTVGYARIRQSDWGVTKDGRMTDSVAPTSECEWTYLAQDQVVVFRLAADPDEQRRILGKHTLFLNARARAVTLVCGQQAPSPDGIDELLLGCEGLWGGSGTETLHDELSTAHDLQIEQSGDSIRARYRVEGEGEGWFREVEWREGDRSGAKSRVVSRVQEIPEVQEHEGDGSAIRVIESEIVAWEDFNGLRVPKVVERTVRKVVAQHPDIVLATSRFEILERRSSLSPEERDCVRGPEIGAGWWVSRRETGFSAQLGGTTFSFAGRSYEALRPLVLADLEHPERILEGASCPD